MQKDGASAIYRMRFRMDLIDDWNKGVGKGEKATRNTISWVDGGIVSTD